MLLPKTTPVQYYGHISPQLRELVLTKALPWGVLLISVTAVIATSILTGKVTNSPAMVAFILLPYTASMILRTNAEYVAFIVLLLASILLLYCIECIAEGSFSGLSAGTVSLHIFATAAVAAIAYVAQMHYRRLTQLQALHDTQVQASIKAMASQERLAALGRMSAAISHQINNPIQVITFALDTYLMEQKENPDELVQIARQHLNLLIEIMGSLNSFVRPNRAMDAQQATNLADATRKALNMYQSRIRAEHVCIKTSLAEPPLVNIPLSDMIQIVSVLIDNAIDAVKGRENPTLTINLGVQGANVWVTVEDNGAGISETNRDHIFEPFFTTKDEGVGLGLFIVYNIVSRHGGVVEYSPVATGGSRFWVKFPIAR